MHLGNLFEAIVHHFLIGGIVSLGRQDEVPMASALVLWLHIGQDLR